MFMKSETSNKIRNRVLFLFEKFDKKERSPIHVHVPKLIKRKFEHLRVDKEMSQNNFFVYMLLDFCKNNNVPNKEIEEILKEIEEV